MWRWTKTRFIWINESKAWYDSVCVIHSHDKNRSVAFWKLPQNLQPITESGHFSNFWVEIFIPNCEGSINEATSKQTKVRKPQNVHAMPEFSWCFFPFSNEILPVSCSTENAHDGSVGFSFDGSDGLNEARPALSPWGLSIVDPCKILHVASQLSIRPGGVGTDSRKAPWKLFSIYLGYVTVCNEIFLDPKWPLFLKVKPPKQGPFQAKQGSFSFWVYISEPSNGWCLNSSRGCLMAHQLPSIWHPLEGPGILVMSPALIWRTNPSCFSKNTHYASMGRWYIYLHFTVKNSTKSTSIFQRVLFEP